MAEQRPMGGRVLVLSEGDNPSFAYFVRPHLARLSAEWVMADSRQPPEVPVSRLDAVVVVRYLPKSWERVIARLREAGCPVAYFMDDDLMDVRAHVGLPWRYRWKIARLALLRRTTIERLASEFWVSSEWLAEKYSDWSPRLLAPHVDALTAPQSGAAPVGTVSSISYHGTASHAAEQRWLLPVIGKLQSACSNTHFTIVGDGAVQRMYRQVPRVSVMQPMSWSAYLAWTSAQPCDIGLAPLVPNAFNAARAPTKFMDFARMGAVGLYADAAPYRDFVRHGIDGFLLPMEPEAWVHSLQELAADGHRCRRVAAEARQRVLSDMESGF